MKRILLAFRTAPRAVQWAGVILIVLPLFELATMIGSVPLASLSTRLLPQLVTNVGLLVTGLGLVCGLRIVRLLFAALMAFVAFRHVWMWHHVGFVSLSLTYSVVWIAAPFVSLGLCFLPVSNRYFASGAIVAPESQASDHDPVFTYPTLRKLGLVLLLGIAGIKGVFHFTERSDDPISMSPGPRRETERIFREAQERQIGHTLRRIAAMSEQYFLERSQFDRVPMSALRDNYLGDIRSIAGEVYPEELVRGEDLAAVMPDGVRIHYGMSTGRVTRVTGPSPASRP